MDLKINFINFWNGFKKDSNYFFHLLNQKYNVIIDEKDPDLLFFSVNYENSDDFNIYRNHKCKKIFYTGENIEPNFHIKQAVKSSNFFKSYNIEKCDFAFSFSRTMDRRNYRLPLWALHIDWFDVGSYGGDHNFLIPLKKINNNDFIKNPKTKFCAAIFSNPTDERLAMFEVLSNYKSTDGYGKPFRNHSCGEKSKYEILKDYKFSICFENQIFDGYFTEKLFHAKVGGTIPIYSTDLSKKIDFNRKCFIDKSKFSSISKLIDYVIEVDQNKDLYESIFNEPLFDNNQIPEEFCPESVLQFFEKKILC